MVMLDLDRPASARLPRGIGSVLGGSLHAEAKAIEFEAANAEANDKLVSLRQRNHALRDEIEAFDRLRRSAPLEMTRQQRLASMLAKDERADVEKALKIEEDRWRQALDHLAARRSEMGQRFRAYQLLVEELAPLEAPLLAGPWARLDDVARQRRQALLDAIETVVGGLGLYVR